MTSGQYLPSQDNSQSSKSFGFWGPYSHKNQKWSALCISSNGISEICFPVPYFTPSAAHVEYVVNSI